MNNIECIMKLFSEKIDGDLDDALSELKVYTLGKLLEELKSISNKEMLVKFSSYVDDLSNPSFYHSYRGYYRYISLEPGNIPTTVEELISRTELAIDTHYTGWKGGEFFMTASTPAWVSEEGDNSGMAIMGLEQIDNQVFLKIENIEKKLDKIMECKLDEFKAE